MTIAESIKLNRRENKWGAHEYALECKKASVKKSMDGSDFMVFTFEDGSIIKMYWS